jgi:hypothetical protein
MSKLESDDKWKCPKCGAGAGTHGHWKGECDYGRISGNLTACVGLVCECTDDTSMAHGDTDDDPCPNATCYHCGWNGTLPVPAFNAAKLKGWAKKAWEAGWKPPKGWTPQ